MSYEFPDVETSKDDTSSAGSSSEGESSNLSTRGGSRATTEEIPPTTSASCGREASTVAAGRSEGSWEERPSNSASGESKTRNSLEPSENEWFSVSHSGGRGSNLDMLELALAHAAEHRRHSISGKNWTWT